MLPDFYKFHAMRLGIENRGEFWKLDFNSEGWLAQNFTPHGAPALQRDALGVARFVVWNIYIYIFLFFSPEKERVSSILSSLQQKLPLRLPLPLPPGLPRPRERRMRMWMWI